MPQSTTGFNLIHTTVGKVIVNKMPCNVILLHTLAAALLKWMAYPSLLCQDQLPVAKELINRILQKKETSSRCVDDGTASNELLLRLGHSNSHIRIYTELIRSLHSLENDIESWLENFLLAPVDLRYMCKLVVCGVFLHSDEFPVVRKSCKILVQVVHECNTFASHMLSVLLHKLTKTRDSDTCKCLLLALPEFVAFKENLQIVIHTLNSLLSSGKSLRYFAVQLYAMALEKEPRCQRFVSDALIDLAKESGHNWRSDVACARAVKHVCENRPELCADFVPLLSQILNRCHDLNGGAASALALDSISLLCESAVIGNFIGHLIFTSVVLCRFFMRGLFAVLCVRQLTCSRNQQSFRRCFVDVEAVGTEDAQGETHGGPRKPVRPLRERPLLSVQIGR